MHDLMIILILIPATFCCSDIVRAYVRMGMDVEVAASKWRSACALLLDFEECDLPKLPSLEVALEGARYVERLQQFQLRYLRCPRHKTLTIWVSALGTFLGVAPLQDHCTGMHGPGSAHAAGHAHR